MEKPLAHLLCPENSAFCMKTGLQICELFENFQWIDDIPEDQKKRGGYTI